MASYSPRTCLIECLQTVSRSRRSHFSTSARKCSPRPSFAPKPAINIKAILDDPYRYSKNCVDRNYENLKEVPFKIGELREKRLQLIQKAVPWRKKMKALNKELLTVPKESEEWNKIVEKLRRLKEQIRSAEETVPQIENELEDLAESLPNLTSEETPQSPQHVSYICEERLEPQKTKENVKSHIEIGHLFRLLDFTSAKSSSGWGYYFLTNSGALLEQALIQYALKVAGEHGFHAVTPPSLVYTHIASACGFKPRDQNGEKQIYSIAQKDDADTDKPELVLAGTAEIPFAAMKADTTFRKKDVPLKIVGPSRCYRAEAGSRGVDTKGLFRVHEFTKVEMFAWTPADLEESTAIFDQMLKVQQQILTGLCLPCRVVEQPVSDLGASAYRKQDIEAYFPSRQNREDGWGEVTSTSMCTDYQTRRLATKMHVEKGLRIWKHTEGLGRESIRTGAKTTFPWTVNGTALAVPRILAALLENHYTYKKDHCIWIPYCLRPYLRGQEFLFPPRTDPLHFGLPDTMEPLEIEETRLEAMRKWRFTPSDGASGGEDDTPPAEGEGGVRPRLLHSEPPETAGLMNEQERRYAAVRRWRLSFSKGGVDRDNDMSPVDWQGDDQGTRRNGEWEDVEYKRPSHRWEGRGNVPNKKAGARRMRLLRNMEMYEQGEAAEKYGGGVRPGRG